MPDFSDMIITMNFIFIYIKKRFKAQKASFKLYSGIALLFLIALAGCNQSADPERNTIGNPTVALVISPLDAEILVGETRQYAVNAVDLEGKYTKVEAKWSSTIGHINDKGEFTAPDAPNFGAITAKFGTIAASTQITVKAGKEMKSFYLVPESGEIQVGRTIQFVPIALNSGGEMLKINPSWSCDNGNITNTGRYSAYGSPCLATIKAQIGRVETFARIKIIAGNPYTVIVNPATTTCEAGLTKQFYASVYDSYGNVLTNKDVTWSTTYGSIDKFGVYTCPSAPAGAEVLARVDNTYGKAYVNTTPGADAVSLAITPPNAVVRLGQSVQFTAHAYNSKLVETALPAPATWTVDNGSVSSGGVYTAAPAITGIANLKAVSGKLSAQIVLLVTN